MKKFISLVALISASLSMSANAGFISGNHTLSNGKTVALQGLEWMPLTYTAGLSRLDIEDGFTDRFGGVWSSSDWRYASRDETETLIGSLWGGVSNNGQTNFAGADWFATNFGMFYNNTALFFFGADGDCDSVRYMSCIGQVSVIYHKLHGTGDSGSFYNEFGLKVHPQDRVNLFVYKLRTDLNGSLLVRDKTPEPSKVTSPNTIALILISLGLVLFKSRARQRIRYIRGK